MPDLIPHDILSSRLNIKISALHQNAVVPTYGSEHAAAFDLYATSFDGKDSTTLGVGMTTVVGTGLAFEVPMGHVMLVFSRSGHGFKNNVRLSNCVGVIDSDYRGEVFVKLAKDDVYGDPDLSNNLKIGDRIAQAMILPVNQVTFQMEDFLSVTTRGAAGLGSTG